MTELQCFFDEYMNSSTKFLCHQSEKFNELWEIDPTKIKIKAELFIKQNPDVCERVEVGKRILFSDGIYTDRFINPIRGDFLKWCISQGDKTINDLFQ